MNMNPRTGIRYTLFRADQIDSDLLDDLLYTHGENISYRDAAKEELAAQLAAWEERCETACILAQDAGEPEPTFDDFEPDLENFDPQIEEPVIEGWHEGVSYRTTWLGGALHLWVSDSMIVGHFALCSPCVPNACDGGARTDRESGFMGYDLPPGWYFVDPDTLQQRVEQEP